MAMTLEIRSLDHPNLTVMQETSAIFIGIWLYLKEETKINSEKFERFMEYFEKTRGE